MTITKTTYQADTAHSNAEFAVKYMKVADFKASIYGIEAEIDLDGGKISGRVPVANIQVSDDNMKAHLMSAEFFDAENHPHITFESTDAVIDNQTVYGKGKLTIKGVTNDIEFHGSLTEPVVDPYGNDRIGLTLQTELNRQLFDLKWNTKLPNGDWALDDTVRVDINLQAVAS